MRRKSGTWRTVALALLLPLAPLRADGPFGNFSFKGTIHGDWFEAASFKGEHADGKFTITTKLKGGKFTIEEKGEEFRDAALSGNEEALAVLLVRKDRERPLDSLVVVDPEGKTSKLSYKPQGMSETYGWIVEVGAVSNDGSAVLAKCARMVPVEMRREVRHDWLILSIEGGTLRILESENAFTKWAGYADKKK